MPARVECPHCRTACQVPEQHLQNSVRCGACGRPFTPQPAPVLEIGGATSPGRVRTRNEDSFLVQHLVWNGLDLRREVAAIVVADGMGGHEAGDIASRELVATAGAQLGPLLCSALVGQQFLDTTQNKLEDAIGSALVSANRSVFQRAKNDPNCKGMGATAVVLLVWGSQVTIGHVGDTRVYHHRAGKLTQITKDQTLVARMVELGTLTPAEALRHPSRNEVSQAVGRQPDLQPARYRLQLAAGDWLLAACDGLHAHLDHARLEQEMNQPASSALEQARRLVALADQRGGSDNCTVVALRCLTPGCPATAGA
jgi:serine/threonine protein phosphatase PrpC